ncbi:MAG TPA: flagellar basal-body MS-ring/collar protein FliF [Acidobacteriaceae bacterium]|jgi:flagellar M-ring protein FliF|nr:flagellar basal-body MS-ring/collar protein FliF [Acidobacteriaceae bacterium]
MAQSADKSSLALTAQQRAGQMATEAWSRWRTLEPERRFRLTLAVLLVLGCFAALLWYSSRPDWRTLYAGLDSDDARQIAQQLTTAGIPFDVSPDGSLLRVPAENLDKARLATTAKGGPRSGRMGFELFDQPNWMGSEFDEKVNYQRALEGELEHTIATLASVEAARVHLVLPHDSLFTSDEREAKASVVLRLRHRSITSDEAEGIANLVASAVDGLHPENVSLVSAETGELLGRRSGDAAVGEHEQELAARIVETLEPVAGAGNVRASVNVDYDRTSADEVDETYDPAQTATLSMQRSEQTSGQPAASGIPGTASNSPAAKPPLYPAQNSSAQSVRQESGTYAVSKKVRHTVEAGGGVRRLTAAVLINYRRTGQGSQTAWQPRSADDMKRLSGLAESAIGFDVARGDQVSVEELPFDENAPLPAPTLTARVLGLTAQSEVLLRYGAVLAGLLAFLLVVARPVVRSLLSPPPARARVAGETTSHLPAPAKALEMSAEQQLEAQKKQHVQTLFDQVAERVKSDPGQSTRLLESWIRSE